MGKGDKFVCPDCHVIISKSRRRRHKGRCGILGLKSKRFRLKREFDERGLRVPFR